MATPTWNVSAAAHQGDRRPPPRRSAAGSALKRQQCDENVRSLGLVSPLSCAFSPVSQIDAPRKLTVRFLRRGGPLLVRPTEEHPQCQVETTVQ